MEPTKRKMKILRISWIQATETLDMKDAKTLEHYNGVLEYVKSLKGKEETMEPIEVCAEGKLPFDVMNGHNRFKAASELGWTHIPAILCDSLSTQLSKLVSGAKKTQRRKKRNSKRKRKTNRKTRKRKKSRKKSK
tara:strand:+ start:39 stop:443 length:405 start_codon:yes stop_codon:yes gene_type:complete